MNIKCIALPKYPMHLVQPFDFAFLFNEMSGKYTDYIRSQQREHMLHQFLKVHFPGCWMTWWLSCIHQGKTTFPQWQTLEDSGSALSRQVISGIQRKTSERFFNLRKLCTRTYFLQTENKFFKNLLSCWVIKLLFPFGI